MNATTHPVAPEELMAFLDGELPADRNQSVSAHIEQCSECRELAASFRKTSQTISNWFVSPMTSNPQFEDVLAVVLPNATSPKRFNLTWVPRQPWRLVAASVVLFSLVGWIAFFSLGNYRMSTNQARLAVAKTKEQQLAQQVARGVSMDGQPIADQQSKVFSNKIPSGKPPFESGRASASVRPLMTLATPGVAADSNGLFHGLGDHVSNSFSIDGQPMIARTISLSIMAKDFDASRNSLDAILARHNGYSASLSVSTPQGAARSLTASLRIPAPQLAAAVNELKALGRVENENQNGEEVTQQHADLVARLKNSRETEQRLQAILVQRTGKISDVLEVEQEIARVRGEIEQMQAHQKNLEHRVDFATIDLNLSEEYKAQLDSPTPALSTRFHNALINGYTSATDSLLALLLFFVQYGPVLLLWIAILSSPGWLLWRRWKRASAAV